MTAELRLTDAPDPALRTVLGDGLDRHNHAAAGYTDSRPLAVVVTDAAGVTLGGLSGRTSLGMCFFDLVYLPESLRGQDVGTRMMAMVEAEALARGCRSVVLFTISFQAPGFYEKLGYVRFGEIACDPPGTTRMFLSKTIRDE